MMHANKVDSASQMASVCSNLENLRLILRFIYWVKDDHVARHQMAGEGIIRYLPDIQGRTRIHYAVTWNMRNSLTPFLRECCDESN